MEISDPQDSKGRYSYTLWIYYAIILLVGGLLLFFSEKISWDPKNPPFIFLGNSTGSYENREITKTSSSQVEVYTASNSIRGYMLDSVWDFPLLHPRALAIDMYDNTYIGESYQGSGTHARILKFSSTGVLLGWWGKGNKTSGWHVSSSDEFPMGNGSDPGEFNYIFKITFDREGNMYVIDRGKYYDTSESIIDVGLDRIHRYDQNGNFMGWFYGGLENTWTSEIKQNVDFLPSDNTILSEPSCIILDQESMIIGSWIKNRIDVYDKTTGKLLQWLGKNQEGKYGWHNDSRNALSAPYFGTEEGAFNGIIDCNLYGDRLNIVSYNSNPVLAEYTYSNGIYQRGLSHNDGHKPQEFIEDTYGNLIFSDNYEGSIKFFDQNRRLIARMQLGPGGNYFGVGDFALDSHGKLYFIEQQKQKLYVLKLEYNK